MVNLIIQRLLAKARRKFNKNLIYFAARHKPLENNAVMPIEMTDKIREETEEFMKSPWCTSRMNCTACQLPGEIHDNILNKWRPDLLCLEWGKPVEAIQKVAIVARAARPPCKEQRARFAACPHGAVEKQLAFANGFPATMAA